MKRLLTTTALVALTSLPLPLAAEKHSSSDEMSEMSFQTNMGADIKVSTLMGRTLYAPGEGDDMASWSDITDVPDNWEDVADIEDILISPEGQVASVLIDAGGFLGMGEKDVQINLEELAFVPDNDDEGEYFIVYTGNKQLLEESEEYDQASSEAEGYTSTRETMASTGAMGDETETAMTDDQSETAMTDEETETAMNDEENMAAPGDRTQMQETDLASVTAEELEGVRVYDANDEWVGEIDTLIIGDDGQIAEVVVDVGGFLGLGEKPVAMNLEQITFMSSDGMLDGLTAYVEATEEELESMPEWEEVN